MSKPALFERRLNLAYKAFYSAAEAGEPGPTNMEIVGLCDYIGDGAGAVAHLVRAMAKRGLITVETINGNSRRVTIVATGKTTGKPLVGRASKPKANMGSTQRGKFHAVRRVAVITLTTHNDPRLLALLRAA